jgi:C-terminal processing protease CtpA/Prc
MGWQVNDVLLTVDGNPVGNLDLEDIKHLTVGDEGSVVKLELRRDGVEKSTILQRTPGEMAMTSGYTHNPPLHSTAPR